MVSVGEDTIPTHLLFPESCTYDLNLHIFLCFLKFFWFHINNPSVSWFNRPFIFA